MPKRDLVFNPPLMNAAGILGFAPDAHAPIPWGEFGAFVTNPISRAARKPAAESALLEFPGGFLLHSGLPNPGLRAAIRRYARRWANSSLPVIVHLTAAAPEETGRMVQALEGLENILAVELGFPHDAASDWVSAAAQAATGELPIIVSLASEQALTIGVPAIDAGAAALSLASPRGALTTDNSPLLTGRLYGPGLFPQTLETVRRLAGEGIPIIGAGGVYKREQAEALLDAGALGVQVGAILWKNASALFPQDETDA